MRRRSDMRQTNGKCFHAVILQFHTIYIDTLHSNGVVDLSILFDFKRKQSIIPWLWVRLRTWDDIRLARWMVGRVGRKRKEWACVWIIPLLSDPIWVECVVSLSILKESFSNSYFQASHSPLHYYPSPPGGEGYHQTKQMYNHNVIHSENYD